MKFGLGAALRYLGAMLLVAVLACAPATAPMAPNHAGATKTDEHESESALVARLFVPGPRMPRDVTEVTVAYPWLSVGRVYWVEHPPLSGVLVVVAALGDGPLPVRLTGDTAALSQFLSRQFNGRFPGAGRFRDVAELLRDVTLPRAAIGSAEFLKEQKKWGLEEWLNGRTKDPAIFETLCTGVQVHQHENEWEIQFNVFNTQGGVDSVRASGTAASLTLQRVTVDVVKPAGEFQYPLVG